MHNIEFAIIKMYMYVNLQNGDVHVYYFDFLGFIIF